MADIKRPSKPADGPRLSGRITAGKHTPRREADSRRSKLSRKRPRRRR